jgi:hypothetical protein
MGDARPSARGGRPDRQGQDEEDQEKADHEGECAEIARMCRLHEFPRALRAEAARPAECSCEFDRPQAL